MSAKRSGLGKGLGALIPAENTKRIEKEVNDEGELISEIDINLIIPNREQPRKHFNQEKIQHLADSIAELGLLQPVVLKRNGAYYEIIAGERRFRALKLLDYKKVPAIIKDVDDYTIAQLALIENVQREDLNPIEEGSAYQRLINEYQVTQDKLSKIVGKSRSYITNMMRLLKLEPSIQEAIIGGSISNGHGRAILSLDSFKQQITAFNYVIDHNLSVRQTEELVKNYDQYFTKQISKSKVVQKSPEILSVEDKLTLYFGTKVNIKEKKGKGKIEIDFYNIDDLNRILDLIK